MLNPEDIKLFREKKKRIRDKFWGSTQGKDDLKDHSPTDLDPENELKRMLPSFTNEDHEELLSSKKPQEEVETQI